MAALRQQSFLSRFYLDLTFINGSSSCKQLAEDLAPIDSRWIEAAEASLADLVNGKFRSQGGRHEKFATVMDLIANYSKLRNMTFDGILLTRFDLLFQGSLIDSSQANNQPIDWNAMNLISALDKPETDDDNLYIFGGKLLGSFQRAFDVYRKDPHIKVETGHLLMKYFQAEERSARIHYLRNEHTKTHLLTSYKIVHWLHGDLTAGSYFYYPYCSECTPKTMPCWKRGDQNNIFL